MNNEIIKLDSPSALSEFSSTLKKFIVDQKLYSSIKGKNYVNVEGWQFAGLSTGVLPVVKSVENVSTKEGVFKYRADVELLRGDAVVGYGVAICSNEENSKKSFDEYAIMSMAQTRAVGKAYRNLFAYLMKMASFEATPAEEMLGTEHVLSPEPSKVVDANTVTADNSVVEMASKNQIELIESLAKEKGVKVKYLDQYTKQQAILKIKELIAQKAIKIIKEVKIEDSMSNHLDGNCEINGIEVAK